jgi:hypothetical protein
MVMQTFMESLRDASMVACIAYRHNCYVQERERHYADWDSKASRVGGKSSRKAHYDIQAFFGTFLDENTVTYLDMNLHCLEVKDLAALVERSVLFKDDEHYTYTVANSVVQYIETQSQGNPFWIKKLAEVGWVGFGLVMRVWKALFFERLPYSVQMSFIRWIFYDTNKVRGLIRRQKDADHPNPICSPRVSVNKGHCCRWTYIVAS